jgi:hypothetical protein
MASAKRSFPVPPDCVYVWRGFMAPPPQTFEKFAAFLGNVFVPACALLQPAVGLRAYIPTMVPQKGKPVAVPDQTALMFWATANSHDLANGALAVRVYQDLHGGAYDMARSDLPEVPVALPSSSNAMKAEQPYFIFDQTADWMQGKVYHVVGARPAGVNAAAFIRSVFQWANALKTNPPKNIDGALVCCGNDYVVAWAHSKQATKKSGGVLEGLLTLTTPQLNTVAQSLTIKAGLWSKWQGIDLTNAKNTSLNIQLQRPPKTNPV